MCMQNPTMDRLISVMMSCVILLSCYKAQELQLDTVGNYTGIGLVQARPNNTLQWGYICDDQWNRGAAIVVCAQLGFTGAGTIADPGLRSQYRPVVAVPPNIALDDVSCQGTEANLWDCIPNLNASWNPTTLCNENELAGVTCTLDPDPVPAGPSNVTDLRCNSSFMQLVYPVPWTVLPRNNQNLQVLNGTNYLTTPYNSPALTVQQTSNEIIYSRQVIMTIPAYLTGAALFRRYDLNLSCTIPRNAQVQQTFRPQSSLQLGNATTISMQMVIYQDRSFQNPVTSYPYTLAMGDWMNFAVVMNTADNRLKVVVTDCLAAPGTNQTIGQNYIFYNNKCLVNQNISATYPLNNDRFGFRLQSFVFDGYNVTRLRCDAIICLQTDGTAQCDRSCNSAKPNGRRRRRDTLARDSTDPTVHTIYSPLIYISTGGQSAPPYNLNPTRVMPAVTEKAGANPEQVPSPQENQATHHQQPHGLVMTLGNDASLPSLGVVNAVLPLVAIVMSLRLLYAE